MVGTIHTYECRGRFELCIPTTLAWRTGFLLWWLGGWLRLLLTQAHA